jgi:hypothetical protein
MAKAREPKGMRGGRRSGGLMMYIRQTEEGEDVMACARLEVEKEQEHRAIGLEIMGREKVVVLAVHAPQERDKGEAEGFFRWVEEWMEKKGGARKKGNNRRHECTKGGL